MRGDETWRKALREMMSGEIRFDEPADRHASIGIGGEVDALVFPKNVEELLEAVTFLRANHIPFLPVGNWTNLIVTSGGYRGVLISLTTIRAIEEKEDNDGTVCLEAESGVSLSELVALAERKALSGMEFCAGIPGSVGGAIRMNAGAYGGEIKDVCVSVCLLDPVEGIRTIMRESLIFAYRSLDLPAETIIIKAGFGLKRDKREKIAGRVREIISLRREKHPLEFKNAGSVFKNPREIPAGRLIEAAGLKGTRIGDAQVSEKHGNFIINRGAATAGEVLTLISHIQKQVFETTGYALETEVKIIGE
jgi:UDP-N-acetylmuramate dehydrogenase